MPFRKAAVRARLEMMHKCRERDAQHQQANHAQPDVAQPALVNQQGQANTAEEEHRENTLPNSQKAVVSDPCPNCPADILNWRIRINAMAWPIRRMKAAEGEQEKNPCSATKKDSDRANDVGSLNHKFPFDCAHGRQISNANAPCAQNRLCRGMYRP